MFTINVSKQDNDGRYVHVFSLEPFHTSDEKAISRYYYFKRMFRTPDYQVELSRIVSYKEAVSDTSIAWSSMRYPGNDPENGPARRNPVKGCLLCGSNEADFYEESEDNDFYGCCSMCIAEQP